MSENRQELPLGWTAALLGVLGDYINGRGFRRSEWRKSGRPIIRIQDLTGSNDAPNYFEGPVDERHIVRTGDFLISWAATLGAFIWRGQEGILNQHIFKVRSFIDKRFHCALVRHILGDIQRRTHGTGMVHITKDEFDRTIVPVPPLAEQQRIADALDELLSDVDAGEAALDQVRVKLGEYRASVLKAAVEGTLTAEWRRHHPNAEPASELLKRMLSDRRRRWDEGQLRKFGKKGQKPPKNWKTKYKEPLEPDTSELPTLPEGWSWVTLHQILWQLRSGTAETSSREVTDYPVLKSSAVRHGSIDFDDVNYLQASQSTRSGNYLQQGDLLITRLSGSVDYVGCCAIVGIPPFGGIQYPDRIFCGKIVPGANGSFLSYCFRHPRLRAILEKAAKSTAGHQRISMSDLHPLAFPLPPLAEQEAIFEVVEDQLSIINHLESDLTSRLTSTQSLRQAILRHAFTGQLVSQDPRDEPASELLKRIAVEREERLREAAAARRTDKRSAKPRTDRRSRSARDARA